MNPTLPLQLSDGMPAAAPAPGAPPALAAGPAGNFGLLLRQAPGALALPGSARPPALPAPTPPMLPGEAAAPGDLPATLAALLTAPLPAGAGEQAEAPAPTRDEEDAAADAVLPAPPAPALLPPQAPSPAALPRAAEDGGGSIMPAAGLAPPLPGLPTDELSSRTRLADSVPPAASHPANPFQPEPQAEPALLAAGPAGGESATGSTFHFTSHSTSHSTSHFTSHFATGEVAPANRQVQAPLPRELPAPLASAQWGQDLGQRMAGILRQGETQVSLQLNPADLGPLLVELKLTEQHAQLHFTSPHAQVRHAVEDAIPQLREALAGQGISLGEAMVGEHRGGGEREPFLPFGGGEGARRQGAAGRARSLDSVAPVAGEGQVNLYV